MPAGSARGTSSAATSLARRAGRQRARPAPRPYSGSARASVSSCVTRWALRVALWCTRSRRARSAGSVASVQRQFGLALQPGQRRAQLVRGVADEAALVATLPCTALQQRVEAAASERTSAGAASS